MLSHAIGAVVSIFVIGTQYEMLQGFKETIEQAGGRLSIHVGRGQIVKYEGERHDSSTRTSHFDFTFFSESERPVTISMPSEAATNFDWKTCLEAIIPIQMTPRFNPLWLQKSGIYKVLPSYAEFRERLKDPSDGEIPIGATIRFHEALVGIKACVEIYYFFSVGEPSEVYSITIRTNGEPVWSEFLELVGTIDEPPK